ncbi:hypothetical protein KFK09_015885 [Dendrobium nobile]|uniref:Uncharacterized protein n=1 Tax=Dendrobium nobile TaxID=94219 RepID=A0A8T3B789_DENNO|nr:hypothetical protein KFK09_015885 [Dendrobium nobile]
MQPNTMRRMINYIYLSPSSHSLISGLSRHCRKHPMVLRQYDSAMTPSPLALFAGATEPNATDPLNGEAINIVFPE